MPKIRIQELLSFSTEDPHHPAANIMNSDPGRKWKCAQIGEKTASVLLQLEKAQQITGIDIGNENSAFVEVLVTRSGCDEFRPFLSMSSFMTPLEARNHQNINKVRMFTTKDFSDPECNEKWDQVKLICVQPYNKHVQYGLSFVTIHTNEGAANGGKKNVGKFTLRPDSPTAFSVGKLFIEAKQSMNLSTNSSSLKGAAAIREASARPSVTPYRSPIVKQAFASSPVPSTSKTSSDNIEKEEHNRNRATLLYDEEDEAPNDKIDRIVERKKREDEEKRKLNVRDEKKTESTKNPKNTSRTSRKRKSTSPLSGNESPKQPKADTNVNTESRKRRNSSSSREQKTPQSPKLSRNSTVLKDYNVSTPKVTPSSSYSQGSPRKRARITIEDKKHVSKPYEQLMEGVVFVISGIQNPERASLRTSALAMGAKYKADWDSSCTHLICAFANTPKFNQVRGKGKIVKKQWIIECEKQRKRLPWRRFCLDKKDITGNESEDEICEEAEELDSNKVEDEQSQAHQVDEDTDEEIERIQRNKQEKNKETKKNDENLNCRVNAKLTKEFTNGEDEGTENVEGQVVKCGDGGNLPVLPNYFTGLQFYLCVNLGVVKNELTKYIIGYNGKIIEDEEDIDNSGIVISYSDDADTIKELRKYTDRLVSPTWLLECHNKKCLLPFDDFLV